MFRKETDKYSAWDDKGVPTLLADGKEVPKVERVFKILRVLFILSPIQLWFRLSRRNCRNCGPLKRRNTTTTWRVKKASEVKSLAAFDFHTFCCSIQTLCSCHCSNSQEFHMVVRFLSQFDIWHQNSPKVAALASYIVMIVQALALFTICGSISKDIYAYFLWQGILYFLRINVLLWIFSSSCRTC